MFNQLVLTFKYFNNVPNFYIVVSIILFIIARLSPYEWQNNRPCNQDSILLENQWSLSNSCWFSVGYLLRQGIN